MTHSGRDTRDFVMWWWWWGEMLSRYLWLSCPFPVTRSGSVVVDSTVIFREGAVSASEVKSQLVQHEKEAEVYNLAISKINGEAISPTPAPACFW